MNANDYVGPHLFRDVDWDVVEQPAVDVDVIVCLGQA